jgi:predicted outer membrane repeat protein
MKHKFASRIIILSIVLALVFSAVRVAPARALGPFSHNTVVRDAYDLLPESELKSLIGEYQGLVLAGSVYPDWAIKGDYENYPGQPAESAHSMEFIATYFDYVRLHYALPYDTEEKKAVAFLLGLIVHNVSDPQFHSKFLPWAYDVDNVEEASVLLELITEYFPSAGVGPHQVVEIGVDVFNLSSPGNGSYDDVDWTFLPLAPMRAAYHDLGVEIGDWDMLKGWQGYKNLSTAQVNVESLLFPYFLVDLPYTYFFYRSGPGGMDDSAQAVKQAWVAAWDLLNDANYSGVNHVRPDGSDTAGCQSWENACTLQRALTHLVPGMEIWVAEGTYKPTTGSDRAASFLLNLGVEVYGGFPNSGNPLFTERNPTAYPTILSGDLLGNDNSNVQYEEPARADNSYHVVSVMGNILLDGLIITGGNANGLSIDSAGGGTDNGGGMYSIGASPTIRNVTFRDNSAKSIGGGMFSYQYSKPLLTNVTFSNNSAQNGGGMGNFLSVGSPPLLANVTFSGNSASQYGGGLYNSMYDYSDLPNQYIVPDLTNVTFSGNSANTGGGIYNGNNSLLTLKNVIIANSPSGGDCVNAGGSLSAWSSNNLIEDAYNACGLTDGANGNIVGNDPLLGTLGDNGSATPTVPLLPGSPAMDAGHDIICAAAVGDTGYGAGGLDQRGMTRPQGPHCDIGAYEYAEPLHVTQTGITTGDCKSWGTACTLQYALTQAAIADEIWVAAGVYKPATSPANRGATFQLRNGVAIYGGFVGIETARGQRNPAANLTVLSGDIDNNDAQTPVISDAAQIIGDNSYHVVTGASGATLDGFTITAGRADWTSPNGRGGGMYNKHSNPTLANITFSGNLATSGGGIYNENYSSPRLTTVAFSGNSATMGGGMYNDSSSPILTNITFSDNLASDSGGALNNFNSSPTLTEATFRGNSATVYGGGMYNQQSSPTLTNITFSDNQAKWGGGMANIDSNLAITKATFSGNLATFYGAGMYNYQSSSIITNVTFSGNSATSYGGGMFNWTSSPIITNVTFSGNSVSGSSGYEKGGGLYNNDSNPQIRNTIFWNNTAPSGAQIYNSNSAPVVSDSVVQGGYADGTNIITADPLLGTLGDYGGSTQTIPILLGSSAFSATSANCPATDQRGVIRSTHICDIGAYETEGYSGVYYVKPAASGLKTCQSWEDACTLQMALNQAVSGSEIWVAAGVYKPATSATNRGATFQLRNGVAIYGGFTGIETARDQRNPAANLTVLSGDADHHRYHDGYWQLHEQLPRGHRCNRCDPGWLHPHGRVCQRGKPE